MSEPDQNVRLEVRLQPRAKTNEIVGFRDDGKLVVRVSAPPVDGKANIAACKLIAKRLRIAPSRVKVVKGHQGREKVIEVAGADRERLSDLIGDKPRR